MKGRLDCPGTCWVEPAMSTGFLLPNFQKRSLHLWSSLSYLVLLNTLRAAFCPCQPTDTEFTGYFSAGILTILWHLILKTYFKIKKSITYIPERGSLLSLPQFRLTIGDVNWGQKAMYDLGYLIPWKRSRDGGGLGESWLAVPYLLWNSWRSRGYVTWRRETFLGS